MPVMLDHLLNCVLILLLASEVRLQKCGEVRGPGGSRVQGVPGKRGEPGVVNYGRVRETIREMGQRGEIATSEEVRRLSRKMETMVDVDELNKLRQELEESCAKKVNEVTMKLEKFEKILEEKKLIPTEAKDPFNEPLCEPPKIYTQCASMCRLTCENPRPSRSCRRACDADVSCVCPKGMIEVSSVNTTCVREDDCPGRDDICERPKVYTKCARICRPTCSHKRPEVFCPGGCAPGVSCICPSNMVQVSEKNTTCIKAAECAGTCDLYESRFSMPCFHILRGEKRWKYQEAVRECRAHDYVAADVPDYAIYTKLIRHISENVMVKPTEVYWTAMTYNSKNGQVLLSTGRPTSYRQWYPDRPPRFEPGTRIRLAIARQEGSSTQGLFDSDPEWGADGIICQSAG